MTVQKINLSSTLLDYLVGIMLIAEHSKFTLTLRRISRLFKLTIHAQYPSNKGQAKTNSQTQSGEGSPELLFELP